MEVPDLEASKGSQRVAGIPMGSLGETPLQAGKGEHCSSHCSRFSLTLANHTVLNAVVGSGEVCGVFLGEGGGAPECIVIVHCCYNGLFKAASTMHSIQVSTADSSSFNSICTFSVYCSMEAVPALVNWHVSRGRNSTFHDYDSSY